MIRLNCEKVPDTLWCIGLDISTGSVLPDGFVSWGPCPLAGFLLLNPFYLVPSPFFRVVSKKSTVMFIHARIVLE